MPADINVICQFYMRVQAESVKRPRTMIDSGTVGTSACGEYYE